MVVLDSVDVLYLKCVYYKTTSVLIMFPRVSRRPIRIPRPLRTTPCWSSTMRAAAPQPDRSAPFTPPAVEATRTMTTSTTGALASANLPTCTEATTTSLRHHCRTTEREGRTGGGGKLKEKTSKKQCGTFFLLWDVDSVQNQNNEETNIP